MFSQYFGQYLLNQGMITSAQLLHALEAQRGAHLKLGILAIEADLLTAAQVEEIHQEQTRQDKRFGEIAVEKSYLTQEQVNSLLASQKKGHLLLGQALIDAKALHLDKLARALDQYKKNYSFTDEQFVTIQDGDLETLLQKVLNLGDSAVEENLKSYLNLFAKNVVRFIDSQGWLGVSNKQDGTIREWAAVQDIAGAFSLTTVMTGSERAFLELASQFAGETINQMGELAQASVAEFLNLHNGIFLVNMSNQGTELQLKPPQVRHKDVEVKEEARIFSVHICGEQLNLILIPA